MAGAARAILRFGRYFMKSTNHILGVGRIVNILTGMVCVGLAHMVYGASPASDTACNDTIANNNNGGSGFNGWTNVMIPTGGGVYTTTDSGLGSNGCSTAWGIYTGTNAITAMSAQRPFTNDTAMAIGQILKVDMQNGGIQNGGSEGLSLYNSSSNSVWELYFPGGSNFWVIHDSGGTPNSTIPY